LMESLLFLFWYFKMNNADGMDILIVFFNLPVHMDVISLIHYMNMIYNADNELLHALLFLGICDINFSSSDAKVISFCRALVHREFCKVDFFPFIMWIKVIRELHYDTICIS